MTPNSKLPQIRWINTFTPVPFLARNSETGKNETLTINFSLLIFWFAFVVPGLSFVYTLFNKEKITKKYKKQIEQRKKDEAEMLKRHREWVEKGDHLL